MYNFLSILINASMLCMLVMIYRQGRPAPRKTRKDAGIPRKAAILAVKAAKAETTTL